MTGDDPFLWVGEVKGTASYRELTLNRLVAGGAKAKHSTTYTVNKVTAQAADGDI